jgi:hypothetical protein
MKIGESLKSGWGSLKAHWGFFLLAAGVVTVLVLWYDHKNNGSLTTKVAGLPIVGKLFAA